MVKRLAIECNELKDELDFPDDFKGYFMVDDWEWPPKIFDIIGGSIIITHSSKLTGRLSGEMEIVVYDDVFTKKEKQITGSFNIVERDKALFLNLPARAAD